METSESQKERQKLQSWAQSLQIPMRDLQPAFEQKKAENPNFFKETFFDRYHLTKAGHQKVAELLAAHFPKQEQR